MTFKLKFQEKLSKFKQYNIIHKAEEVGEITLAILNKDLHIQNVFIYEEFIGKVGFGDWVRTFEDVYVYDVLPKSIFYWTRRGAIIVSTVEPIKFEDIIFENTELEEKE